MMTEPSTWDEVAESLMGAPLAIPNTFSSQRDIKLMAYGHRQARVMAANIIREFARDGLVGPLRLDGEEIGDGHPGTPFGRRPEPFMPVVTKPLGKVAEPRE